MKKKFINLTNIDTEDFVGKWNGEEFLIKKGETKLFHTFLANKLSQDIASKMLHDLKRDIHSKDDLKYYTTQMLGETEVDVEIPEKTETDILKEEMEFANNQVLKNKYE